MLAFFFRLRRKSLPTQYAKIPDDAELGEKLVDICILVLEKAVKLTKTTADDALLEAVKGALVAEKSPPETIKRGVSETPVFINNYRQI